MGKVDIRQTKIVEMITELERVEVAKLSELLGVSQVTVRKDLDALEQKGLIIREHGFATLNSRDDMNTRLAFHYEIKQQIAKEAAKSIQNGDTLMIESGSCCALLAQEIANRKKDVTIITNSAFIADYIHKAHHIKVILLGGEYQNEAQVNVGPMIRKCVESFNVNQFFIGTDGFSKDMGFTGNDYMRAEAVRDMAKHARNVIVITESSKFDSVGLVSLLNVNEVNEIYTDDKINSEVEAYLTAQNILVHKAS